MTQEDLLELEQTEKEYVAACERCDKETTPQNQSFARSEHIRMSMLLMKHREELIRAVGMNSKLKAMLQSLTGFPEIYTNERVYKFVIQALNLR